MSHRKFLTVYLDTFRPSIFMHRDRPLLYFDSSGPSTFSRMAVHLDPLPFTLSQKTIQFGSRPSTFGWTVQFRATVHFHPFGPFTLNLTHWKSWRGRGHDFFKTVAWTWTRLFFRNRGVYMDVDTEIFENCGVDMDTAWNRCPPNSDGQYNIESNLENGGYI